MQKNFEKGTEMFFMFKDYWKIVQDFWIVEEDDAYWDEFVDAVTKFYEKYKTKYAKALIFAILDEKEREYAEMMKKKRTSQ